MNDSDQMIEIELTEEVLPEGWTRVKFGDIAEINPSRTPVRDEDTEVTFLGMADVSDEARIISPQKRSYKSVKTGFTAFAENDLLIAKITPCFENGKGALAKGLTNGLGFGSTEFHVIRAKEGVSIEFLYYHSITKEFRGKGEQEMTGSAGQKRVPANFLRNYNLALPPLTEQQKIASILGKWDEGIQKLQNLIVYKAELKRGLVEQLLNQKKRFKEFAGMAWETVKLGDVAKIASGGTPSRERKDYWGGSIPWVTTTLIDFKEINKAEEYITELGLNNSSAKVFPAGTLLMAMYGQGQTRGRVGMLTIPAATNQACAAIIPNLEKVDRHFLFQNLASRYAEIRGLSNVGNQ
jgi:type I restriction enzyme S subunit